MIGPSLKVSNGTKSGKPYLSWEAVNGAATYQIYRSASKNGTYKRVASVTGLSKTDSSAAVDKTYWYKVRAVDAYGYTGPFSSKLSITVLPATPEITVTIVSSSGKPKISWKACEGAASYQIYYSSSKDGTYKRLTETKNTYYTWKNAPKGKTYYYKVRAVSANGAYSRFSGKRPGKATK
ncbi:MAG: hypothetical protein IIY75_04650, partial [Erysipelotrichales bacterium]|nr:hypothetical protein [Erysipelotrichales bacterium]